MFSIILITHWFGDFVAQTDEMAKGKSTSNRWLIEHIAVYTGVLILGALLVMPSRDAAVFGLLNGAIHFGVDYVTSRMSSRLWKEGRVHDFFVVIGADQLLHTLVLYWTFLWMT